MGRKKIDIKKINDEKTLLVTFAKRKVGLFNKAFELSQLCECQVAILIFTNKNRLHKFASHDLDSIVKRYNEEPECGELTTSEHIIKRREKKKQSKLSQSDEKALDGQYSLNCGGGGGDSDYDGPIDDEALRTTANYGHLIVHSGLPQHNEGLHLKPVFATSSGEEQAVVVQMGSQLENCTYVDPSFVQSYDFDSTVSFNANDPTVPQLHQGLNGQMNCKLPTAQSVAEANEHPPVLETQKKSPSMCEVASEELVLPNSDIGLCTNSPNPSNESATEDQSPSRSLHKKLSKRRIPIGSLLTSRPPGFGDGVKCFDPTIASPPHNIKKGESPRKFPRRITTTDSDLCTPEPRPRTTPVFITENTDVMQAWSRVPSDPSDQESMAKQEDGGVNGNFTRLNELNQPILITPDPAQLTIAPFDEGTKSTAPFTRPAVKKPTSG
uniref:MADS-box domain-containing protein n=2 Tax=Mesocestoides corti TaxID=53468 RepID=A0A5K3EPK4_MESCO